MLPEANILSSDLSDTFCKIDLSRLTIEEMLALADISEDCIAGLCHGLHFISSLLPHNLCYHPDTTDLQARSQNA